MYGKAQADFASLGNLFFELKVELRFESNTDTQNSVQDPLASFRAGMNFNATVTLPKSGSLELGSAAFTGTISPTRFEMNANINVAIEGFSFLFEANIIAGSQSGLYASLFTSIQVDDLGIVQLSGTLSSDSDKGLNVIGVVDLTSLLGDIAVSGELDVQVNQNDLL